MEEQMLCKLCHTPITQEASGAWIHETGFYQCPGSRSEYDLAEPDLDGPLSEQARVLELDGSGI